MLRKMLVVLYKVRYRVLALNLRFDRVKEPYRIFFSMVTCGLLFYGLASKNLCTMNLSLAALLLIIGIRIYWINWAKKNFGDKQ